MADLVIEDSVSTLPFVAVPWFEEISHLLSLWLNACLSYLIALSGNCALDFSFLDRVVLKRGNMT